MPTIAITDYTFPIMNIEQAILSAPGLDLRSVNDKRIPEPQALVVEADAVITQFSLINADVIGAMQRAKVIVRDGNGYDNVDVQAAHDRRIPVCTICKRRLKSAALVGANVQSKSATLVVLLRNGKAGLSRLIDSNLTFGERSPCCDIWISGPRFVIVCRSGTSPSGRFARSFPCTGRRSKSDETPIPAKLSGRLICKPFIARGCNSIQVCPVRNAQSCNRYVLRAEPRFAIYPVLTGELSKRKLQRRMESLGPGSWIGPV